MDKEVWGVKVEADEYELVSRIASLLYGPSEFGYAEYPTIREAFNGKRLMAEIALRAVREARA
jgi:hypothetical protein